MKLGMTLLVRDEEDIIEWNLRYHLSMGIDHFIVTDNLSVDGTPEVLRRYRQRGVLTLLHESSDDYSQDRWVTRMAELAQAEQNVDWLLHSDADEFWWPGHYTNLKEAFSTVPPGVRAIEVERHNYLGPADHNGEPFFDRMVYRQANSVNALGDPLPPKVAHRPVKAPHVRQGNHIVSDENGVVTAGVLEGLSILHFPARTPDQLRNKIANGGAAYRRNTRLGPAVGLAWRTMYSHLLAGRFDRVVERCFVPSAAGGRSALSEDYRLRDLLARL